MKFKTFQYIGKVYKIYTCINGIKLVLYIELNNTKNKVYKYLRC